MTRTVSRFYGVRRSDRSHQQPQTKQLSAPLRDRLAPHVRAYTGAGLRDLFRDQTVAVVHHSVIYPGFDNVVARHRGVGSVLRKGLYALEHTPMQWFGLSHFLVIERVA